MKSKMDLSSLTKEYCEDMVKHYSDHFWRYDGKIAAPQYAVDRCDMYEWVLFHYGIAEYEDFERFEHARELRGICFTRLVGEKQWKRHLSLGKFYALGEHEDITAEALEKYEVDAAYHKVDGTLIRFVDFGGKNTIFAKTRRSFSSPEAQAAYKIYQRDKRIRRLVKDLLVQGLVPFFEYTSPNNVFDLVIYSPEERLDLIQIRSEEGGYLDQDAVAMMAHEYALPYGPGQWVERFYPYGLHTNEKKHTSPNRPLWKDWYDSINFKGAEGVEGCVVRLKKPGAEGVPGILRNDMWLKIKTPWFLKRHKITDDMKRAHNIIRLVLEGDYEEAREMVIDEKRVKWMDRVKSATLELYDDITYTCLRPMGYYSEEMSRPVQLGRQEGETPREHKKRIAIACKDNPWFHQIMEVFNRGATNEDERLSVAREVARNYILHAGRRNAMARKLLKIGDHEGPRPLKKPTNKPRPRVPLIVSESAMEEIKEMGDGDVERFYETAQKIEEEQ